MMPQTRETMRTRGGCLEIRAQARFRDAAARYRAAGLWRDETLVQHARARLETDAGRVALIDGGQAITYGRYWADAAALCGWLLANGLRRGDVISYQLP